MKISIGSDHRGYTLKEKLKEYFSSKDIIVRDFGTDSEASVDYPDYAKSVGTSVREGETQYGVLICGSGIGVSIAANKQTAIRAVNVNTAALAEMARKHNNANVICFGSDFIGIDEAAKYFDIFINTEFEGGERHNRRISKLEHLTLNT